MSWVKVGLAGASVVGSLYTAAEGSRAASRAADKQVLAAGEAQAQQQSQFEAAQAAQAPFQEAGLRALGQQEALLGIGGEEAQQQAFSAFSQSPGQQFLRDQQERSLLRNASAIGGLGGGNVRTALQQQAFGRAQTDFGNQFNRLGSISGAGQSATQNIGQLGAQTAGNIGQVQQDAGAARASGILGQQQALQGGLSGLAGAAGMLATSGVFDGTGSQGTGTVPAVGSFN